MLPKYLQKIISYFKKFPGIGEKTAERMALHLIEKFSHDDLIDFANNIQKMAQNTLHCSKCNIISETPICANCSNLELDKKVLIVESSLDVYSFMKTNIYSGYYYVLGNLINFQKGLDATSLKLDTLISSITNNEFREVIICTNSTLEGEITANHIKGLIKKINPNLIITRLAYGLPSGADLKYADSETLRQSLINRTKF